MAECDQQLQLQSQLLQPSKQERQVMMKRHEAPLQHFSSISTHRPMMMIRAKMTPKMIPTKAPVDLQRRRFNWQCVIAMIVSITYKGSGGGGGVVVE